MNKERSNTILYVGLALLVLSVIFTVLVTVVDVRAIGPNSSSVGFAGINGFFSEKLPYNHVCYKLSQLLGYLSILIFLFFFICGIVQLLKRKSFFKVDQSILVMVYMMIILVVLYIAFDKIALNYRPVLLPGETSLAPSYPSTHTLLAVCIFGAARIDLKHRIGSGKAANIINWMMIILMAATILARFLAGVHWFTDIIGGLLISGTLLSFYAALSREPHNKNITEGKEKDYGIN